MKLSRPLLAAVLSGALLTGGAVWASPALADPPPTSDTTDEPLLTPPGAVPPPVDAEPGDPDHSVPDNPPDIPPPNGGDAGAPPPNGGGPGIPPPNGGDQGVPPPNGGDQGVPPPDGGGPGGTPPENGNPGVPPPDGGNPGAPQPPADTAKPTGWFKIDRWSIWVGQQVTVTVGGVSDGDRPAADVRRVITWGDGTTSELAATRSAASHPYTKVGRMPVTVTLTDKAGNKTVLASSGPTVTTPGKFKVNKASVWHGERFTVALSGVPSGTTKIVLYWGDGRSTAVKGRNQTVTKWYWTTPNGYLAGPGAYPIQAVFSNRYGDTIKLNAGRITIKRDSWAPKVTVTKPKSATKLASWKAVKGTATDRGAGVRELTVVAMRSAGNGRIACYTAKRTWVTLRDGLNILSCLVPVKVSQGKYSLPLKGMKKGQLVVTAIAGDWSENVSRQSQVSVTIR